MFTSENTFHVKNMHKIWDKTYFVDRLGASGLFTINIDTNGWLLNLINTVSLLLKSRQSIEIETNQRFFRSFKFGYHKGFDGIKNLLEKTNDLHVRPFTLSIDPIIITCFQMTIMNSILKELNLLLKPLASCCSFLNRELFVRLLEDTFRRILELIKKLDKDDFKEKVTGHSNQPLFLKGSI